VALEFAAAPKIIARMPFLERADHPAAMPVFVVSRAAADAMVTETEVWSMRVAGWSAAAVNAVAALADVIALPDRAFDGAALLVSVERGGRTRLSKSAPRYAPRPSSAATRPAIRSPPKVKSTPGPRVRVKEESE
jgi:hypothetical protein